MPSTMILVKKDYPLLPRLFNIVLAVLSKAIRQENGIKSIQIGKKEKYICKIQNLGNVENPKESTKKLLELVQYLYFNESVEKLK